MRATVIGAGVAGLTTALALRSTGVDVTLVEAASDVGMPEVPGLAVLSPNAGRILRALRLLDAIEPHASQPQWRHVRSSASGYVVAWQSIGELARARYGAPWMYLPYTSLLRVLAAAASERGVELCANTRFEGLDAAGAAVFDGGQPPSADVLIGADGADSQFAHTLGLAAEPDDVGWYLWHGWLEPHQLPGPMEETGGAITHWLGSDVDLVTAPCVDNRWWWQVISRSPAPLATQFAGWGQLVTQMLAHAEPSPTTPVPVAARAAPEQLNEGHRVLVGAAAHGVLPHCDQGPALAIEDAWVLAHLLEDFEGDIPAGLAEYHRHRRGRVLRVQRHAHTLAEAAHEPSRWRRARRTVGMAVTSRLLPELTMEREDWLYAYDAVRHYG